MEVHLSDIAKRVGVSKMTVSRVLREDPAVAAATRDKVLAAAKQLGYVPNPKLARLMSEMAHSRSKANALGELALITTEDTEFGWKKYYHQLSCFEGAKAEAQAYGYNLLPVWALSRRFSKGRLTEFLWARGVDGLVVMPLGRRMIGKSLDIDWNRFCSVQIGATLSAPKLNLVRHNHYDGMMQTLLQMEKLGYERIGLCFSSDSDVRSYHRWASAYLYWRTIRGYTKDTLPSFHYVAGEVDHRAFKNWIQQHGITGIIGMDTELLPVCERLGIKIPQDLGFSVLDHPGGDSKLAGIDQIAAQLGRMAIDLLMVAVRKGAKGIPPHPVHSIIEGKWTDGQTLRRRQPTVDAQALAEMQEIEGIF
jgi:LacI family transcriptional regulator